MTSTRRDVLLAALFLVLPASGATSCKKKDEERCRTCGMKVDPASAWRTELVDDAGKAIAAFDTPRCALLAWRGGKVAAHGLRVLEYYDRAPKSGEDVRFVVGGDVIGPMGPDFVPVDPARVEKFIQDHGAERALRLDEITSATLTGP